jgi:3-hydroxyisobutyrate dehydrogenase-like beta-hydroxyacid dehydrogenase
MGSVLAGNLVASGFEVLTYDVAGPGRSPAGATFVSDIAGVAQSADVVVFSLPNGDVCATVA